MENLTKASGAIYLIESLAPLEGYNVVVFTQSKGGLIFDSILTPEDGPIKLGFLRRKADYVAYAVNCEKKLCHEFNTPVLLNDQIHHLTLHIAVYFYVSDAKLLAVRFKRDPLKLFQEEVTRLFKKQLTRVSWDTIYEEFKDIEYELVSEKNIKRLKDFSSDYGLELKEIELTHSIPEKFIEPEIVEEEYNRKKRVREIKKKETQADRDLEIDEENHKSAVRDIRRVTEVKDAIANQGVHAVEKVVDGIHGPDGLTKAAYAANQSVNILTFNKGNESPRRVGAGGEIPVITDSTSNSQNAHLSFQSHLPENELTNVITQMASSIGGLNIDHRQSKSLLSHLLHLQAELLLEEDAEKDQIDKYYQEIKNYVTDAKNKMTADLVPLFQELTKGIREFKTTTFQDQETG